MKNYKSFRRLSPEEWENDKEWLGKRMSFLWDMRNYYPDIYLDNELSRELQDDFYGMNCNEVGKIARNENSYKKGDVEKWSSWSAQLIYDNYIRLTKMKKHNKKEFLKKCNCYLYTFICQQRYDEVEDIKRTYEYY